MAVVFWGLRVLFIYHFFAYVGTASGSAATNALNELDNEVLHKISLVFWVFVRFDLSVSGAAQPPRRTNDEVPVGRRTFRDETDF